MASSGSEEIRESLKPIFLTSWVFGVPRVHYKYSYRVIYSIVVSVIYVSTFVVTFNNRMNVVSSNFNQAIIIYYASSQIVTFCGSIGTILFWIAKGANALENAIMGLVELDVELKALDIEVKHRAVIRRQKRLIALFTTIWIVIIIMHEFIFNLMGANDNIAILKAVCLAYSSHAPHLAILLGELVFSTIMFTLYQRFKWINQSLREFSKNQEYHRDTEINSTEESLKKIERLYKVHQRLSRITEEVSLSFSWQLYSSISVTFCLLVYRLVILYSLSFLQLEQMEVRILLTVIWIIYYNLKFWMITMTCCHTSDEANKLGIMLHRITMNDEKFHRMLHQFSVHLYQTRLFFTAGGFFAIDLSLVHTIISQVTTFILVAVDVWNKSEDEFSKSTTITP